MRSPKIALSERILLRAGDGGLGRVSLRRNTRSMLLNIPDGGNGGDGGDIRVQKYISTYGLDHLEASYTAASGEDGLANGQSGKKGKTLEVLLPLNSCLRTADNVVHESLLLKGGHGHAGNKSTSRPNRSSPKNRGQSLEVVVEITKYASAVLIGPPNSGKSSLLNQLCGTKYRVAPYPGSTEVPNFGVMFSDSSPLAGAEPLTIAEIPGIVDYNSFRAYSEIFPRTDLLVIVSPDRSFSEHKYYANAIGIISPGSKSLFVLSKIDSILNVDLGRPPEAPVVGVSAKTGHGITELKSILESRLQKACSAAGL